MSKNIRLCSKCKHHSRHGESHICIAPKIFILIDYIYGNKRIAAVEQCYCTNLREETIYTRWASRENHCGPAGLLWEKKGD